MNEMVVLIIEDDIHIKRLISTTLIASGYKVLLAKDGKEAILEATTHNPDIILLDLGLPDMDGIEIIEKIRNDEIGKYKVIVSEEGHLVDGG